MRIISIQNYQQNNNFKAKIPAGKAKDYSASFVTKKLLEPRKISDEIAQKKAGNMEKFVLSSTSSILGIDLLLKEKGISYCEPKDGIINIGGNKNGDFYQIKTSVNFTTPQAQEFIFRSLMGDPTILGGFIHYQDMINDIGRQDIIKKGLKVYTYELNNNVTIDERMYAAKNLTKYTKIPITHNDMFFLGEEGFYYDKDTKTAYGVNIIAPQKSNKLSSAYRTCKFITDEKGKAIGFKVNDWNWYHRKYSDSEYVEQQEPSVKLPPIIGLENNKEFAESFRFGNAQKDTKLQIGIPKVLEHLHEKAGLPNVYESDLQLVKYYNKDGHIERRIAYYNNATGYSLVYNQEGKFMYQLNYNRDAFGKITACSKL